MDLKEFYFQNIKEDDYHYKFFKSIKDVNKAYNVFMGEQEVNDYEFEVYDPEEAILKFRELCQPEITFDKEKTCWFYLIVYYLYSLGYEIKQFPRLLARPPVDPSEFTYRDIRNRIIAEGDDDGGTVRYATRRAFVEELTFEIKSPHIEINDSIEQKFKEISNRSASFDSMKTDEKLVEISNLIENLLKKDGKFDALDYTSICFDFITDSMIKEYRKKMHCFRHSTEEAISERKAYSEDQKKFLIDYGLIIIKTIHSLTV